MELSDDNYISEEDNYYPPTQETNAESTPENQKVVPYKKWINSKSEISRISSIINGEIDTSFEKESLIDDNNKNKIEEKNKEKEENIIKEENNSEEANNFSNNNNKIIVTFLWTEGGYDVKLTGSFCEWKTKINMDKDPNDNTFKFNLPLDNKIYQFKFIVDGEWRCSEKYQTEKDGFGNINNFIDLTNYIDKKEKKDIKEKKEVIVNDEKDKNDKININKNNNNEIQRKKSLYSCQYPSDDSIMPSPVPNKRYFQSFKLDKYSHQNSIGKNEFYLYNERYTFSHETSSKPIFLLGHVNLNHFISTKNKKKINLKNCMSFRYREKACTVIYYK